MRPRACSSQQFGDFKNPVRMRYYHPKLASGLSLYKSLLKDREQQHLLQLIQSYYEPTQISSPFHARAPPGLHRKHPFSQSPDIIPPRRLRIFRLRRQAHIPTHPKVRVMLTAPTRAECIVNLAELPMQITTCLEAINDVNELFNDINSNPGSYSIYSIAAHTHMMYR